MVDGDYYELLGVAARRRRRAIKAAYRRLAMECHPDRHGGCTDKEAHFKAISEAYDVLKDPQKRAAYDRFGNAAFQNGGGIRSAAAAAVRRLFRHLLVDLRRVHGPARAAAERRARRRPALRPRADAGGGVRRHQESRSRSRRWRAATAARAAARAGKAAPQTCATCSGAGKVRAQQGFFVVERGCPTLPGTRRDHRRSLPRLRRRRPRAQAPQPVRQDPGRSRRRHPHPRRRRRRSGSARRRQRRPLHFRPHEAARDLRARRHDADRRMPGQLHHRGAGRIDHPAGRRWRQDRDQDFPPASSRAKSCASAAPE